jgi:hypothetical protein
MKAFENFPDYSKIWIYAAQRPITPDENEFITARLENFMDEWAAHGAKLEATFSILYRRFIVIAVDEGPQNATGCSIDSCVHEIQAIGKVLEIDFFDRMRVVYRDENNNMVVSCTIPELKEMIADHDFPNRTPVFDNSIQTLGDLRTRWEIPAISSWIGRYLKSVST